MNRIERAVTAAAESNAVTAGTELAPFATVVVVSATGTDATVTTGGCIYVAGSTQRPVLDRLQHVGDVDGMSAADLLRTRRAAL